MTTTLSRTSRPMRIRTLALAFGALVAAGCSDPNVPDYNNQTEDQFKIVDTRAKLQQLATGLADADRQVHDFQILLNETIGRNVYRIDAAENRYITEPLGDVSLPPESFIGSSTFAGPYRTIRTAQNMIDAVNAGPDKIPESFGATATDFDKAAARGFAETFKALSYIRLIEQRDTVGIPIYTSPTAVNPIRCKEDVLTYVAALLDTAATDLAASTTGEFGFALPSGFAGFDTPETFLEFTNALKARVDVYRAFDLVSRSGGANPGSITPFSGAVNTQALDSAQVALDNSFLDLTGNFDVGVYHTYSPASGDLTNGNANTNVYRVNPVFVRDAEGTVFTVSANGKDTTYTTVVDKRVRSKVQLTFDPSKDCIAGSEVNSCFIDLVNTATHALPITRNDELALLQAEVFWGKNQDAQALAIVNTIRNVQGGFTTPLTLAQVGAKWRAAFPAKNLTDHQALLREILFQKRYSLFFETTTRLPDYRMFGITDEFGKQRGFDPIASFPIPSAEALARNNDLTRTCGG